MGGIATGKGRIGLIVRGEDAPDRLPILFLHGVGSDKSVWAPQLEHFSPTRRAIAADYPGYGDSAAKADASREDFADAMVALLDALKIDRAHVCGLSLGGIIAMLMAMRAPDRIASLVLADTFAVHPDGQAIYDGSSDAARTLGMAALAEARVDRLFGSNPPPGLREEVVGTMSSLDVEAYSQGARAVWLADLSEELIAVRCPALVLCGEEDRITPPSLSHALAGLIDDAKMETIAGAGHLSNAETPAAFNHVVEQFLSTLEKG